jgi:MerR family regulatory protein
MNTSAAIPELTGHDDANLLIGDVARLSGLSIDTLRYYDRAGCSAQSTATPAGVASSIGTPWDCWTWCCGCGERAVEDVRHFVDIVRSGDTERAGRLDLLRAHRRGVLAQLDQLKDDLAVIDWKIAAYQAGEDGTEPPPPPPGWPRPQGHLPQPDTLIAEPPTDQE